MAGGSKSACASRRLIEVRGWRVEWRPRAGGGHSSYAHGGGKRGDLYLFPPRDGPSGAQRPAHPLASALGDASCCATRRSRRAARDTSYARLTC